MERQMTFVSYELGARQTFTTKTGPILVVSAR